MLADALLAENELPFKVEVAAGKAIAGKGYKPIWNISRNAKWLTLLNLSWKKRFQFEQLSFLAGLFPGLISNSPAVIYLAEYELYCWLFKIRKLFNLPYSLILYTGGMAVPGLFDKMRDRVHHISDQLVATATKMGIPEINQWMMPHFVRTNFNYNDTLINEIREKAGAKKIVLVVGAMNTDHKRMDMAATILGTFPEIIFPVFIGDETEESPLIQSILKNHFGHHFLMIATEPEKLGSYYAAADLFFSASAYESFGLVYIEALWHGLPMLCQFHDNLQGITGGYADECDMGDDSLASQVLLQKISALPVYNTSSIEAHVFVDKVYSWHALRESYVSMFKNAIRA
jgi:glycosyltransferase involved in cell wall biosynthesis